jgi:hypothetical protein
MQRYIERWLQIEQRLADAAPTRPGPQMLIRVNAVFQELQAPFEATKPESRRKFLHCECACPPACPVHAAHRRPSSHADNYIFVRIF